MSEFESSKSHNVHDPITTVGQDVLERQALARTVFERISQSDSGVFGIYGGWGTGKTSLLELLRGLNTDKSFQPNKNKVHIEIIDAWKYEGTGSLLIPIIVKLKKLSKAQKFAKPWKVMVKRAVALTGLSMAEAALKKVTSIGLSDIEDINNNLKDKEDKNYHAILNDWGQVFDDITEEQKAFETIVDLANEAQKCDRLVLCIDNLDRCAPDKVITLLESIKLFLSVPNCTWVFAMDSEVVARYINHKYEGARVDGNSYLDKIIPEQYHLSFFPEENDRRVFDLIRDATGSDLTLNDWKRLPLLPHVMVPRRLKKSAAKFAEYFDGTRSDAERDTVFLLSLLYHTWPEFYQRLSSASAQHVGGMLANFFKKIDPETGISEKYWGEYSPLPLDKKFAEDQDLIYFLKTAFPKNTGAEIAHEIRRAMDGLREVGLP